MLGGTCQVVSFELNAAFNAGPTAAEAPGPHVHTPGPLRPQSETRCQVLPAGSGVATGSVLVPAEARALAAGFGPSHHMQVLWESAQLGPWGQVAW